MEALKKSTVIVYLIGLEGVGKLTIAEELKKGGYKIVHNHLINDPIFSLLDLDGITPIAEKTWCAVDKIRQVVLDFIKTDPFNNIIFTNVLIENSEEDQKLYSHIEALAKERKSIFVPVRLMVSKEERARRIVSEAREKHHKTRAVEHVYGEKILMSLSHPHLLNLDVTNLSAQAAAHKIQNHVKYFLT